MSLVLTNQLVSVSIASCMGQCCPPHSHEKTLVSLKKLVSAVGLKSNLRICKQPVANSKGKQLTNRLNHIRNGLRRNLGVEHGAKEYRALLQV